MTAFDTTPQARRRRGTAASLVCMAGMLLALALAPVSAQDGDDDASPATAQPGDDVTIQLADGSTVAGTLTRITRAGVRITITEAGTPAPLTVRWSFVQPEQAWEMYRRVGLTEASTADALVAAAQWCGRYSLADVAASLYQRVLDEHDANHVVANVALGRVRFEGRWVDGAERERILVDRARNDPRDPEAHPADPEDPPDRGDPVDPADPVPTPPLREYTLMIDIGARQLDADQYTGGLGPEDDIASLIAEALGETRGVSVVRNDGDFVARGTAEMALRDHATVFGDTILLRYQASLTITVTEAASGDTAEATIETTQRGSDAVKVMDAAVTALAPRASARIVRLCDQLRRD